MKEDGVHNHTRALFDQKSTAHNIHHVQNERRNFLEDRRIVNIRTLLVDDSARVILMKTKSLSTHRDLITILDQWLPIVHGRDVLITFKSLSST